MNELIKDSRYNGDDLQSNDKSFYNPDNSSYFR